ncbi:T-cell immunoglobulin and mucin domain-containing protein 4-like [Salvelinus fontinalis]|uniref:T-cell immunoglobulin and mucin domain-containing protein 4-like n=1 Tax=Salvelinus fontinalis TaxID=8038 RepID=UPI0024856DC9|nr:T-cell immunoglobulin and mucin domain-containing protein 4-like [Salvelinus fontinalis]
MDLYISCCWLVLYLFFGGGSTVTIQGYVGDVVTLTCKYDARHYGTLSVCWGRGHIPKSGCDNEILRTEGVKVTHRASVRYNLQGDLRAGDVSLTITQAQVKDSGIYGCRVDIPGWFNDQKHHLALVIKPAPETTPEPWAPGESTTVGYPKAPETTPEPWAPRESTTVGYPKEQTTTIQTTMGSSVPPDPPTVAIREISARSISVLWSTGSDGNTPITAFHLECKSQSDSWVDGVRGSNILPWERETAINDLRPFYTYNIRMFTKNNMGLSKPSNELTVTTKEAAPDGPPQDVKLEALSSHNIRVTWTAPELSLQNGVILGYQLRYSEYSSRERLPVRVVHLMDRSESFTMNNLQEATKYSVTLHTINSAGMGPSSQELVCSTLTNEHSTSTIATTTSSAETWLLITDSPTQGQRVDDFSTTSPLSNSTTDPALSKKLGTEEQSGHLVAILVPVLVLGLLVVMAIIWQFRRTTLKKGNWKILWKNNDFMSFGDSEPAL